MRKKSILQMISAKSNIAILIGGSMFIEKRKTDTYTLKKLNNKKYFILGCNFGPYKTNKYYQESKKLFEESEDTCFRESKSYELFDKLKNTRKTTDLAFCLELNDIEKIEENMVVISVMDMSKRFSKEIVKYYENLMVEICNFYKNNGMKVMLISLCKMQGDESAIKKLQKKLDFTVDTYLYNGNLKETIQIFKNSKIIVGTRFHANIMGLLFQKKVVPVIYSKKTSNFLKDLKFDDYYIDIQEKNKLSIDKLMYNNNFFKCDIEQLKKEAEKTFEKLDLYLPKVK